MTPSFPRTGVSGHAGAVHFLERERLPAGAAGELTPCWVDGLGKFSKDFFEGGLRPRTSTGPARPSTSDGAGPGRFAPVIPPGSGW
ncbi:hypothetical protein DK316_07540 [Mycobacterium tuberculosis]|nr:hypothetical protein DK316_07540 [Mycobacterium tuberculosis]